MTRQIAHRELKIDECMPLPKPLISHPFRTSEALSDRGLEGAAGFGADSAVVDGRLPDLPPGIEEHGHRDRAAPMVAVVKGDASDPGQHVEELEMQVRAGGQPDREIAAQLRLRPDRAVGAADPLDHQRRGELQILRVVRQNALQVVGVPGGDPFGRDGIRFSLVHGCFRRYASGTNADDHALSRDGPRGGARPIRATGGGRSRESQTDCGLRRTCASPTGDVLNRSTSFESNYFSAMNL